MVLASTTICSLCDAHVAASLSSNEVVVVRTWLWVCCWGYELQDSETGLLVMQPEVAWEAGEGVLAVENPAAVRLGDVYRA